ncbi:MAG: DUF3179 domain-containing protein [Rhodobacteraceae bacterium]|nr:DUF3179 domain-containing protein [Paracoccaceae bacterium]
MLRTLTLTTFFALMAAAVSAQMQFWQNEWPDTDFSKTSVDFSEIMSGGPPKDGIPSLASVTFVPVAGTEIPGREPVITIEMAGQTPRAYPVRYLTWHEIANDVIGDVPVAVTFCPLCNSGIVFDRRLNGETLSFGVTGKLRFSDMVMFDRETESWWQQFTGEAIVGELTGQKLTVVVSWTESMEEFAGRNPQGMLMAEPTGYRRAYGANPYAGYDGSETPFLYRGEEPPFGIQPLSRVVKVGNRAWPLGRLAEAGIIEEAGFRLIWSEGMASALDTREIAKGREVGNIRVFDASGNPVGHDVVFAFAFHAFAPDGEWMLGE